VRDNLLPQIDHVLHHRIQGGPVDGPDQRRQPCLGQRRRRRRRPRGERAHGRVQVRVQEAADGDERLGAGVKQRDGELGGD
jgi:hypothetical protein